MLSTFKKSNFVYSPNKLLTITAILKSEVELPSPGPKSKRTICSDSSK